MTNETLRSIAVTAEKSPRLSSVVTVICVGLQFFAKLTLAYCAASILDLQKSCNKLWRKTGFGFSSSASSLISIAGLCGAFVSKSLFSFCFALWGSGVGPSLCSSIRACVTQGATGFYFRSGVVLALLPVCLVAISGPMRAQVFEIFSPLISSAICFSLVPFKFQQMSNSRKLHKAHFGVV